ncbi:hypothetical protein ACFOY5_09000 [Massilia aurea]|jgi:hypothetical protein|uniref:hypothetical protein n=1 Tax=Massilia aurea TaxID=373040 RepID=UPI002163DE72|nr:hypothetical protein [Massilia aurea]MCS0709882.1 hypothetical protein [Massilia aurea]
MADSTNPVPAMMTSPCTRTRRQLVRPLLLALAPVVLIMIATGVVRWTSLGIDLPTPVWLFIWSKLVIVTVVVWRFAWQWYRQEAARRYGEPGAR